MIEYFLNLETWQQILIGALAALFVISIITYICELIIYAKHNKVKAVKMTVKNVTKEGKKKKITIECKTQMDLKKVVYVYINGVQVKFEVIDSETIVLTANRSVESGMVTFAVDNNRIIGKGEIELPEEVVEEPVKEEPVQEEVAEEPVKEEPVQEEVVEEPVEEEPVQEEAVEEPVEEEPVQEDVAEEPVEEEPAQEEAAVADVEPVVVAPVVVEDSSRFVVRYRKSFMAKLIQTSDQNKDFYTIIKNYILSYKKVKSRVSWNYESYNKGRQQLVKVAIKGKTLLVYLALDPKEYEDSKYFFDDVSDVNKYVEVPMKIKVKSNRGVKYAKELIDAVMAKFGIEQGEVPAVNYYLPYETTEKLIEEGLIVEIHKAVKANSAFNFGKEEERRQQKPEEVLEEDDEDEDNDDDENDDEDEEETKIVEDESGVRYAIRYRKSFMARLIQTSDVNKNNYSSLKNYILGFKNVKSRVSKNYDSFNTGRQQLCKIVIRGKTLTVFLALNPADYENSKYSFKDVSTVKKYADVPMKIKVKSERGYKYAIELINDTMAKYDVKQLAETPNENYYLPYEDTESLIAKKEIVEYSVVIK